MFNAFSIKEKVLFLFFPFAMMMVILFLTWQSHKWSAEAAKAQQEKEIWQNSYIQLTGQIADFHNLQADLLENIKQLKQQHQQTTEEIHNALQNNQSWSNQPVPDDISRLFNENPTNR